MKLRLYFFGKKNEVTAREQELIKRIGYRCKVEVIALPQAGTKEGHESAKKKEAGTFLTKIDKSDLLIAFDEHGTQFDSVEFSMLLRDFFVSHGTIHLVIGGAYGLHKSVLRRADARISFGKMVWTRNLCRLMACEQLYRALEIDGGGHFHKA